MKETQSAYDKDDTRYTTPDKTTYAYDAVGRLATMSAPPSAGQSVRNDTTYSYYDNGWTKTSSDPWDIVTSYDYNELGAQTARTLTSAGGSSNRTMSWSYFPDGKLKARSDDGVPVGKQVVLVDNSDFNNTTATGTWPTASTATNKYGTDYATHAAGTGANVFTWQLNVPQSGTYQVYARFPTVSGAAVDAKYTVTSSAGPAVKTVNQTAGAGTWVSLGSFSFAEGNAQKVTLSDQATGTVVADAVKLVRDNSADVDNEKHDYSYRYDTNGNLTTITDASPATRVDSYAVTYTGLNQVDKVTESKSGAVVNTTSFTYNENSAPLTTSHDKQYSSYEYDARDLVSKVTNGKSATDASPKVTTYTYTSMSGLKPAAMSGCSPARVSSSSRWQTCSIYAQLTGRSIDAGHIYRAAQGIADGSNLAGLVILDPPDGSPAPAQLADGRHVEFLLALPLHRDELDYAASHGVGALMEKIEEAAARPWDPRRRSIFEAS